MAVRREQKGGPTQPGGALVRPACFCFRTVRGIFAGTLEPPLASAVSSAPHGMVVLWRCPLRALPRLALERVDGGEEEQLQKARQ